jgi:hypothetical protein
MDDELTIAKNILKGVGVPSDVVGAILYAHTLTMIALIHRLDAMTSDISLFTDPGQNLALRVEALVTP